MQNAFTVLEINKLLELTSSSCFTSEGKQIASEGKLLPKEELEKEFSFLNEMDLALAYKGQIGFISSSSLAKYVSYSKKGASLSIEGLYDIHKGIDNGNSISNYIASLPRESFPLLYSLKEKLPNLTSLDNSLTNAIGSDLTILDEASSDLKRIRHQIKVALNSADKVLNAALQTNKDYLTSFSYTLKNGHYVLPVSSSYKGKVKGIIQDVSSTGVTTFIEPEEMVRLNNKIFELKEDEKKEIERIIASLSNEVSKNDIDILTLNYILTKLDYLQARVIVGRKYKGHVASIGDYIYLPSFIHPLLDETKVIANTLEMKEDNKICIISGPNAGGKTIVLKSVGLCAYLLKLGYMLPTEEGAVIPYFKNIYLDIGDSQSIAYNLSTFSGHCSNIASILDNVGGLDLVLLDEVGTGTAPNEGEALAESIVSYLLKKHCFALVSSHFDSLKSFALTSKGISNASMEFDLKTFLPTYHLLMGLPGESFGLEVARRFGINEEVLSKARSLTSKKQEGSLKIALDKLSASLDENKKLKLQLLKKEEELNKKEKALNSKKAEIEAKERQIKEFSLNKQNEVISKAKEEVKEIISTLSKPDIKLHEAIEAKKKLDDLLIEESSFDNKGNEKISLNDYVSLPSFGVEGKITRINGKKIEITSSNGMVFNSSVDKVIRINEPKKERKQVSGRVLDSLATSKGLSLECNLIGKRYDEANRELDHYLDSCRLKGYKRVRIIHGLGSGALKRMTFEYAKNHSSFIDHLEPAGEYEGGAGASIIYLK